MKEQQKLTEVFRCGTASIHLCPSHPLNVYNIWEQAQEQQKLTGIQLWCGQHPSVPITSSEHLQHLRTSPGTAETNRGIQVWYGQHPSVSITHSECLQHLGASPEQQKLTGIQVWCGQHPSVPITLWTSSSMECTATDGEGLLHCRMLDGDGEGVHVLCMSVLFAGQCFFYAWYEDKLWVMILCKDLILPVHPPCSCIIF